MPLMVILILFSGYIAYTFVIGAYSYWGPKAGKSIYNMVTFSPQSDIIRTVISSNMFVFYYLTLFMRIIFN